MNSYTGRSNSLKLHRNRFGAIVRKADYTTAYHPKQLVTLLRKVAGGVAHWLTSGSMLRISQEMRGTTQVWRVYDPVSNRTFSFDQEDALRIWLEERYYQ